MSLLWLVLASLCSAQTVRIAAAANLTFVLKPLDDAFIAAHPGATVTTTFGASGNLVAQIRQGAPYDVFLSADLAFPRKLIAAGAAQAGSLKTFAYGKLVLWTMNPDIPLTSIAAVIRNSKVVKLAIANPRTAPYGHAAQEAIARLGLIEIGVPKLVVAENVAQTAQYVSTGNADAGFVALSLVLDPDLKERGRYLEVPPTLYSPIAEGAVLTTAGANNDAARQYLAFLSGNEAHAILARFGYGIP